MTTTAFVPRWLSVALLAAAASFGQNQTADYNTRAAQMSAAVRQEDQRHTTRLAMIQKESVDANTQFQNDLVNCAGDSSCIAAAHKRLDTRTRQIAIERNNEEATHAKNMIDIPLRYGFRDIYDTQGCTSGAGIPCKSPCQNASCK